mmetsp:Transcript_8587/g.15886  ORF Transcript_8587/g.15886 Transcript_8587/m.15886 type:complete len:88 (+) Transcript_8587:270-533(+)
MRRLPFLTDFSSSVHLSRVTLSQHHQPNCLSPAEVCESLGLPQLRGRKWHVQSSVAIKGEGLYEGLDWLCGTLKGMKTSGITSNVKS